MKTINPIQKNLAIKTQHGLALLTIMIFLILLTIIGISSTKTSRLEQMMAGNTQWSNIAFQAAESALVEAYDDPTWTAEVNPGTVPSATFDKGESSYDYERYFIDTLPGQKGRSSKAWGVGEFDRAIFQSSATGNSKEKNSGAILATAQLEEGILLLVPAQ